MPPSQLLWSETLVLKHKNWATGDSMMLLLIYFAVGDRLTASNGLIRLSGPYRALLRLWNPPCSASTPGSNPGPAPPQGGFLSSSPLTTRNHLWYLNYKCCCSQIKTGQLYCPKHLSGIRASQNRLFTLPCKTPGKTFRPRKHVGGVILGISMKES